MTISINGKWQIKDASDSYEYSRYERQYTSAVHIIYRYLCRDTANNRPLKPKNEYYKSGSDLRNYFSRMKNVELIQENEWFFHCAYYDAYELIHNRGRHVVFGGKNDYKAYLKGLMTQEEYLEQKLRSFYCIGTAMPYKGN